GGNTLSGGSRLARPVKATQRTVHKIKHDTRARDQHSSQARNAASGRRMMEQTNKERSLVSKVMDGLVTGIVEEKYGAVLPPQDVLSKEFDVSRTVMREAL